MEETNWLMGAEVLGLTSFTPYVKRTDASHKLPRDVALAHSSSISYPFPVITWARTPFGIVTEPNFGIEGRVIGSQASAPTAVALALGNPPTASHTSAKQA